MKTLTKSLLIAVISAAALTIMASPATAKVAIGSNAPDIQVIDSDGQQRSLSEFEGQDVILEWTNHQCPYVRKHYGSDNMQSLQKRAKAEGFAWLSIISSAPGKQGHVSADRANELTAERGAEPTAVLLDSAGDAGHAYEAKTTPHMYIIDQGGILLYQGAIDSIPNSRKSSIADATNYVSAALDSMQAGTPIEVTESQPYGCTVKY